MSEFTVALAQMAMASDKKSNLIRSLTLLEKAAREGADLILFPEVQLSPFFAQFPGNPGGCCGGLIGPEAISDQDPVFPMFQEMCRKCRIAASPNFYYQENGAHYDASFLMDEEGRILGCQKMVHIAEAPQFYEQDYYTPSDDGFRIFDLDGVKIGIVICFDRHYPESIRTEALRGAELILIPTANTAAEPMELFEQEIRVQAFQNECYIAMCNRVGQEAAMNFSGESLVVDPDGNTIAKAGAEEEILFARIAPERVKETRRKRPYLNLRRPQWYY
ncbi:MAG: carbon-nitrogen hydrolase family protein [Bilifractor sp.]